METLVRDELKEMAKRMKGDQVIWGVIIILFFVSMLSVYSASGSLAYKYNNGTSYYLLKQVISAIGGLALVYFAHLINYKYYSRIAQILWVLSIPLLLYTMFFGATINEASRWIRLPVVGWTFQTSDLAKLALIMYLARLLTQKQATITNFKESVLPMLGVTIIPVVLIAKDNLSTALILFFTSVFIMFIGRVSIKHLMLLFAGSALFIGLFVSTLFVLPESMHVGRTATWKSRINSHFLEQDIAEEPYQTMQANIAIAKGGFFPNGPGNSTQKNFLPEAYSDFIYAIIIEEYGLIGGVAIILLYLVFLYRCIKIVVAAPKAFGAFLAVGLGVSLVLQAMINMAVAVGLFPVTGVTLPLVSMGGSSVVFTSIAFGIVLSVSRNIEMQKNEDK